ncbi:hypothetical protein [Streptomyces telluris]|uniref:Uncharacterized protein n=1 Tax=Streptomyces telluris TaxID=2720021 RepID=A0A9X2LHZ0_9ACTN|nr:hypothetical protein [Streptomyces telluris]MCQ8771580.1 hypothetical protein [Streptomyces telluris]NJP79419.1 hypothetical protein [Streptomyces telluris]
MPGLVLHAGAVMMCAHPPGLVTLPAPTQQKVLVSLQPVATVADVLVVGGCSLTGSPVPPCVTVRWFQFSPRVLAGGRPVLVHPTPPPSPGPATGVPAPGPPMVQAMQIKVRAS